MLTGVQKLLSQTGTAGSMGLNGTVVGFSVVVVVLLEKRLQV